ncbi:maleylpyruvate isomerase N-terminal domain-containing protein [Sphaerisporangium sp. NBC_01403]
MDIREAYRRALDCFGAQVHRVRAHQWRLPTACGGWDVRTLVDHLVGETLTRGSRPADTPARRVGTRRLIPRVLRRSAGHRPLAVVGLLLPAGLALARASAHLAVPFPCGSSNHTAPGAGAVQGPKVKDRVIRVWFPLGALRHQVSTLDR